MLLLTEFPGPSNVFSYSYICYIHFHFETTTSGAQSVYVQGPWRAVWSYHRHHERCMERNTLFSIWLIGGFLMGLRQICRHNLKHNRPPSEIVS